MAGLVPEHERDERETAWLRHLQERQLNFNRVFPIRPQRAEADTLLIKLAGQGNQRAMVHRHLTQWRGISLVRGGEQPGFVGVVGGGEQDNALVRPVDEGFEGVRRA